MSSNNRPTSVIIAAHNESTTIGKCLDLVLRDALPDEFEVIVAANGCSDDTAAIASERPGVRVLDLPKPGKCSALNAAEELATGFPRIYLDADIAVTTASLRLLRDAVTGGSSALAAFPERMVDARGSSLIVRAHAAINSRLPVFRVSLFGHGLIAISEEGRRRFDTFPDIVADDLYLDSLFSAEEKRLVSEVVVTVGAPSHARELIRRLTRVRRGNTALRASSNAGSAPVRRANRMSWFMDVVVPEPRLLPAGLVYAAITAISAVLARRGETGSTDWGSDPASRALRQN